MLRPLDKLVVVEPVATFGGTEAWQSGSTRFGTVVERLGMSLAEVRAYGVDSGTTLASLVVDNSTTPAADDIDSDECVWTE